MRRQRKRPLFYYADCMYDGTVTAAYPIRKPLPKRIKEYKIKIDEDGICDEGNYRPGKCFSDRRIENRFRFQDIISNRLNTRRALREIAMPELSKIRGDINAIQSQLNQIKELLGSQKTQPQ